MWIPHKRVNASRCQGRAIIWGRLVSTGEKVRRLQAEFALHSLNKGQASNWQLRIRCRCVSSDRPLQPHLGGLK